MVGEDDHYANNQKSRSQEGFIITLRCGPPTPHLPPLSGTYLYPAWYMVSFPEHNGLAGLLARWRGAHTENQLSSYGTEKRNNKLSERHSSPSFSATDNANYVQRLRGWTVNERRPG